MQMHARATPVRRQAPTQPPLQPPEPQATLLESLDPIEADEPILVIGQGGLDLMCALLRAGAMQVTHLCSHEHPETDSAGLAIVPQAVSLDFLARLLPAIRRALHANGRLVANVATQTPAQPAMQLNLRHLLTQHGFTSIRIRNARGALLLRAELPSFGLRHFA